MSVVSGVTLICNLCEEEGLLEKLNDLIWILKGTNEEFVELSNSYGGGKHPQHLMFGAGINHLDEERFIEELLMWKWQVPEHVILIIRPEEGPLRVCKFAPPDIIPFPWPKY